MGREPFKCVKTILVCVFNVSAKKHGMEENVVYFIANAAIVFSAASRDVVICLHFAGATCFIHCRNLHIAFFIGQTSPRPRFEISRK